MFRNYLAAALRNLVRNRLYAAINIVGLAVGFAAALLIALFVRDELSYDRWIPKHERTYLLSQIRNDMGDLGPVRMDGGFDDLAPLLKLGFPGIEAITTFTGGAVGLRHGDVENNEDIFWADPTFFDVLPLPAISGDLKTALDRPDGIVVTRSVARKYFGRDDVVGETLEVDRQHPMTVTAVLEDLPSNTHLKDDVLLSAHASFSPINMPDPAGMKSGLATYVRLAPGYTGEEFQHGLATWIESQANQNITGPPGHRTVLVPMPLAKIHLAPPPFGGRSMTPRGSPTVVVAVAAIGLLIVFVASINFINLMTAWAARRATEVGVRKVSGAERRDLIVQFIGEALLYVFFGVAVAVALTALLLPHLQAFLQRPTLVRYGREPAFIFGAAVFSATLGILAGLYPALVLSVFKPATVLKTIGVRGSGSVVLRRILAVVQFGVLIGLILATSVIYDQLHFAFNDGMRVETDQTLIINTSCRGAFTKQVQTLPGVRSSACSGGMALERGFLSPYVLPDGSQITIMKTSTGPGFFEFYGLHPLAGRLFSADRGDEMPFAASPAQRQTPPTVVINETAARKLRFESPAAAIGQAFVLQLAPKSTATAEIIGVVPDFALDAVGRVINPAFYYADPARYTELNVRLTGRDLPETLAAIDRLWKQYGEPKPMNRMFLDQRLQELYKEITRQGQVFAAFAGVAVFIACLGLFGLAAFTAERRSKEISIRKSMGANRGDILRLVVWEFIKPVLWANVIAWPVGYYVMQRWLQGFAYHVDISPWIFLAASVLALLIAALTVSGHALMVARTHPVTALRYE